MEINIIHYTEEEIKALEDKYFGPGGELHDLAAIKDIDSTCPSMEDFVYKGDVKF